MDTNDRIFATMAKKGITQKEFAQEIGLPAQVVTDWKKRRSESYMKRLPQIAEALGTSTEYLLTGKENEPTSTPASEDEFDKSRIMAAFLDGDENLTPEEQDALWEDVYEYARFKAAQWAKRKQEK